MCLCSNQPCLSCRRSGPGGKIVIPGNFSGAHPIDVALKPYQPHAAQSAPDAQLHKKGTPILGKIKWLQFEFA